jgi:hypothetical protein
MAYTLMHGVIVVVYGGGGAPEAAEWGEYTAFLRRVVDQSPRFVVMAKPGSNLAPYQRKDIVEITSPDHRVAMVAASTFARGIMKGFALVDPNRRVYDPDEMDQALDFANVARGARDDVKRVLAELSAQVA